MRRLLAACTTMLLAAAWSPPASADSALAPSTLNLVRATVVTVKTSSSAGRAGGRAGSAVRVGPTDYVTAWALVARTREITLDLPGSRNVVARPVEGTNLPLGLSLLRVSPRYATRDGIARTVPAELAPARSTPLWLVRSTLERSVEVQAVRASRVGSTRRSALRRLSVTRGSGTARLGGALFDRRGRLRGVAVLPPQVASGDAATARLWALMVRPQPAALGAAAPKASTPFPAVPVAVAIGGVLLLSQIAFAVLGWFRRRRSPAATLSPPVQEPAPTPEPLDDLEITLRR